MIFTLRKPQRPEPSSGKTNKRTKWQSSVGEPWRISSGCRSQRPDKGWELLTSRTESKGNKVCDEKQNYDDTIVEHTNRTTHTHTVRV